MNPGGHAERHMRHLHVGAKGQLGSSLGTGTADSADGNFASASVCYAPAYSSLKMMWLLIVSIA